MYWFLKVLFYPLACLFFLPRFVQPYRGRIGQRVILMGNHVNLLDPVLLAFFFPRKVHFMAKKELFRSKLAAAFLKALGAFPVNRGRADVGSIKKAMSTLYKEKCLGIFPEGTRIKTGEIGRFERGLSAIAIKTKTPIVPVYHNGNYGFLKSVKLCFGEPIYLNELFGHDASDEVCQQATEYLENAMRQLKERSGGVKR